MKLPGMNYLQVSPAALCAMIEDQINDSRLPSTPKLRVTGVRYTSFSAGYEFEITTDKPEDRNDAST